MKNVTQTLKELEVEDFIWIIYAFFVIGAITSNMFERDWLTKHHLKSRKIFKTINLTIFLISFGIYFYFVLLTYKRIKELKPNFTIRDLFLTEANFVAACLFLIGGLIYLFTEAASYNVIDEPPEEL